MTKDIYSKNKQIRKNVSKEDLKDFIFYSYGHLFFKTEI